MKKMVAAQALDREILKKAAKGNWSALKVVGVLAVSGWVVSLG